MAYLQFFVNETGIVGRMGQSQQNRDEIGRLHQTGSAVKPNLGMAIKIFAGTGKKFDKPGKARYNSSKNNSYNYNCIRRRAMQLLSELLMGASQFKKLYESQCENILCRFSLKQIELDILLFLANNPPYDTARDIAELRGLAKSNLSTAIERLSGDGYLTSQVDPRDRRFAHLSLTEKAHPVVSQGKAMQKKVFLALMDGIPEEDKEVLVRIGKIMKENMKEAIKYGI